MTRASLRMRVGIILMAAIYAVFVGRYYAYVADVFHSVKGFTFRAPPLLVSAVGVIVAAAPALFLPTSSERTSSAPLWFLYLLSYVPGVVVAPRALFIDYDTLVGWQCLLLSGFFCTIAWNYFPRRKFRVRTLSLRQFTLMLAAVWVAFVASIYYAFGANIEFASLYDVYGRRSEYASVIQSGYGLVGYIVIWSGYWLAPILLLCGVRIWSEKKLLGIALVGMGLMLSAYVYLVAAFKSIALGFVVVLTFWWIYRRRRFSAQKLFFALFGLIVFAYLLHRFTDFDFLADHLLRRLVISPGMNSSFYFDYFRVNPGSPGVSPANLIASIYYGTNGSANADYLAAGFQVLGVAGPIAAGLLCGFVFWLCDCTSRDIDFPFASSMLILQSYALANTALPTVMVSYGMLASILTLAILPRKFRLAEARSKPLLARIGQGMSEGGSV